MVSSAVASSFETIRTLRERPTQPLSPEDGWQTSWCRCMQCEREKGITGSASGAGPGVGEWLRNDLGFVLVHDISDMGFMHNGHSVAV